jgi:hypothetical protein
MLKNSSLCLYSSNLGTFWLKIEQFWPVCAVLYPRWPPWLKIKISSNGQICSILSRKVSKFELYRHNDELFNIYYGIFYELWTFAYFDRLCKLEKRGMKFKKNLLWNYWANLNQTLLKWSLGGPLSDTRRCWRTHFWKGTTQRSFQQSLVEIGSVVSEKKKFF